MVAWLNEVSGALVLSHPMGKAKGWWEHSESLCVCVLKSMFLRQAVEIPTVIMQAEWFLCGSDWHQVISQTSKPQDHPQVYIVTQA